MTIVVSFEIIYTQNTVLDIILNSMAISFLNDLDNMLLETLDEKALEENMDLSLDSL